MRWVESHDGITFASCVTVRDERYSILRIGRDDKNNVPAWKMSIESDVYKQKECRHRPVGLGALLVILTRR